MYSCLESEICDEKRIISSNTAVINARSQAYRYSSEKPIRGRRTVVVRTCDTPALRGGSFKIMKQRLNRRRSKTRKASEVQVSDCAAEQENVPNDAVAHTCTVALRTIIDALSQTRSNIKNSYDCEVTVCSIFSPTISPLHSRFSHLAEEVT